MRTLQEDKERCTLPKNDTKNVWPVMPNKVWLSNANLKVKTMAVGTY
jgi:hypothetical protein